MSDYTKGHPEILEVADSLKSLFGLLPKPVANTLATGIIVGVTMVCKEAARKLREAGREKDAKQINEDLKAVMMLNINELRKRLDVADTAVQ